MTHADEPAPPEAHPTGQVSHVAALVALTVAEAVPLGHTPQSVGEVARGT